MSHKVRATRQWYLVSNDNKRNIVLQKSCRKWDRETSSRPLFVLENTLNEVKANGSAT